MEYLLGPVPWALATPDGMPMKTNKAVLMQKLENVEVIFASDNECFVLSTADGETTDARLLQNLSSSHEEAGTLLILHSIYVDQAINSKLTDTDIIIRSPDTDVFLLLIAFCQKYTHPIYFDTGMGNKRKMIHIQTLCQKIEQDVLDSILGLNAFTGCDVNSAFVQKGKSKPLNILKKNPEFAPVFKELGSSVTVSDELLSKLEKFVCQLYGKHSYSSTNKLLHDLVRQEYIVRGQNVLSSIRGFDISLLPPCRAALKFHCLRADIAQPDIPDPEDHGYGVLSIHWCTDLVPQELADILSESHTTRQQESDYGDDIESDVDSDAESQNVSDSETSEEEEESG
ncbi:hypothetical protein ElyMa_002025600 [Elysia marginata]|uniref:3'-5' exonuclease domain-containing protein n=1 Tax=Elysia marginata TaxID=1093978 RepID=A0AAV4F741_9GAST|nr:hypothetical protein ElyMa_002025600 [Elysia marginata]